MSGSDPKHTVVVGCLVRREDRVLMIKSPKRGWEIPQGRVEEGETVLEAARREVLEETGIHAEPTTLAGVYSQLEPVPAVIFTFLAEYLSGEPLPQEGESLEVEWLTPEQALERVAHPVNLLRLRDLLEFDGRPAFGAYASKPFRILSEKRLDQA